MKITEADRQAVRVQRAVKHKMTEQAKAALRGRSEHERINKEAGEKFLAAFDKLPKEVPAMRYVLRKIFSSAFEAQTLEVIWHGDDYELRVVPKPGEPVPHLTRMAQKLLASLESGLRPAPESATSDIVFLATLTPAEERMTEKQFEAELRIHAEMKHKNKLSTGKRQRASRKAKELVWGTSGPPILPTPIYEESIA